ncbi:MAG: hypothetical protein WBF81_02855 [Thermoplasmata archaeon]
MSSPTAAPAWKTGTLWGILAFLLIIGTVGSATTVYGLLGAVGGDPFDLLAVAFGAVVAVLSFLFMAGILYRVDRYRGAAQRRVEFFE